MLRKCSLFGVVGLLLAAPAVHAQTPPAEAPPPPAETPPPPAEAPPPPAEAPPPAAPAENAIAAKYDKGFTFESADGNFELKAGIRGQLRLEVFRPENDDEFESHFVVPRMRLQLEGHAYGKQNAYKIEFDMANKGFSLLKDYFYDHTFPTEKIHLRAGQWKKPFSRAELVSDFGSEFLERSPANDFGGAGRDLGIALHNDYEKSPEGIEWALGVFNAASEKPAPTPLKCTDAADATTCTVGTPTNVPKDFGPMIVARLGFNHGHIKGYSEGDLEGGPVRVAVAASYKVNLADFADNATQHAVEVDGILKVNGLDVSGAFYLVKIGDADWENAFYGQAGYMVLPKKALVAARVAMSPSEVDRDKRKTEALGAIDYFFAAGHNYKWMIDGGVVNDAGADTTDVQIRTQLQFVF